MPDKLNETLEQLTHEYGLDAVLRTLSDVCSDNADLIRSAQGFDFKKDEPLAQKWQSAADAIDRVSGETDL